MKKILLSFILMISIFLISGQSVVESDVLNGLSQDDLEKILNSSDQDNVIKETDSVLEESTLELNEEEPINIFGFDYIRTSPTSVSAISDIPLTSDYRISLNDELVIILTGDKKEILRLNVLLDGTILFPELGSISVVNETFSEVKNKLRNLVKTSYVGVDLDLSIGSLSPKMISIIGAVKNPGSYTVNPFTTISSSLAYSGGLEEYASLRTVKLIKPNGNVHIFDFYDLLIEGRRDSDLIVGSGDTVLVQGTTNYVDVRGEVIRPMIYEYTSNDKYEDLINFALGLNSKAESNNINSILIENGRTYSSKTILQENIGNKDLEEIFVGTQVTINDKDLFVTGTGVTSGYFTLDDNNFSGLLEKLEFSSDIYPFYAIYEQEINNGLGMSKLVFSLADPDTYKDFTATKNSKISFFNRDSILASVEEKKEDNANEDTPDLIENGVMTDPTEELKDQNLTLQSNYVQISFPDRKFEIPLTGKLAPRQIHTFFGFSKDVDIDNVAIITSSDSSIGAYDKLIESQDLVAISFPPIKRNLIEVEIQGQIRNPGVYSISSSSTLSDLYILAGGMRDDAFQNGILVFREDIKNKQIKAIKEAKSILTDAMIQKANSSSNETIVDIEAMLKLADLIEPNGRVAGEFLEDSETSRNFVLKDGDSISIPSTSFEVIVQGEVLNSSSFIFDKKMDYKDYIDAAGGFSDYADKRSVFVIKANGLSVSSGNNIFSGQVVAIEPGDTIVVPRNLNKLEALPMINMATKIIADIAFSAASLNAIQN
tara:strand:- start:1996 stop:4305 length:2310 start_codon:yes stop_codon:yes gene_type:complete